MLNIRLHRNRYVFIPKLLPTAVTIILFSSLIALGCWQLHRAKIKHRLLSDVKARETAKPLTAVPNKGNTKWQFYPIILKGHFDNKHQFLLDNRYHQHHVGYQVLTPLLLANSHDVIIINRGWIPRGRNRQQLPKLKPVPGAVTIHGLLRLPSKKGLVLGQQIDNPNQWPRIIQKIDIARLAKELGQPLYPYIVLLAPTAPHGFTREWKLVTILPAKHFGYAAQWFTLALVLLIIYIVMSVKKEHGVQDEHKAP